MYNINGKVYRAEKSPYTDTAASIRLNENLTAWFKTTTGVRQGDSISPTLFNIL